MRGADAPELAGDGEPLVLVGCGGFGRETAQVVHTINAALPSPRWRLLGFLDDDRARHGEIVGGVPILGPAELIGELPEARAVVCAVSPRDFGVKRRIVGRLGLAPDRYATLVHPEASLAGGCHVAEGTVMLAGVTATADVEVGAHVALMPNVVLTHDTVIADHATLGAGAYVGGGVRVLEGAYLGAGCLVREHVTIGAGALVGMGAVVTRDVPAGEIWAGVPAAPLRRAQTVDA